MHTSRFPRFLVTLALVVTLLCSFSVSVIFAADTTPTPTPTPLPVELKLTCDVPSYSENSATTFNYSVNLTYSGTDTVTVNLSTTAPQGWNSYVTYTGKQVTSVPMGPLSYGSPDSKSLSVSLSPNSGVTPNPGDYTMSLKVTSGALSKSIDLTATIKNRFAFSMNTSNGNLATKATSGKATNLAIELYNSGSAELSNVTLSSQKPDGWTITFDPSTVAPIAAGKTAQVNAIITPAKDKTVAGDYNVTLSAANNDVNSSLVIRITVETPAIWGTVAIIIIVVVIVGLAVLFLRLGRR